MIASARLRRRRLAPFVPATESFDVQTRCLIIVVPLSRAVRGQRARRCSHYRMLVYDARPMLRSRAPMHLVLTLPGLLDAESGRAERTRRASRVSSRSRRFHARTGRPRCACRIALRHRARHGDRLAARARSASRRSASIPATPYWLAADPVTLVVGPRRRPARRRRSRPRRRRCRGARRDAERAFRRRRPPVRGAASRRVVRARAGRTALRTHPVGRGDGTRAARAAADGSGRGDVAALAERDPDAAARASGQRRARGTKARRRRTACGFPKAARCRRGPAMRRSGRLRTAASRGARSARGPAGASPSPPISRPRSRARRGAPLNHRCPRSPAGLGDRRARVGGARVERARLAAHLDAVTLVADGAEGAVAGPRVGRMSRGGSRCDSRGPILRRCSKRHART